MGSLSCKHKHRRVVSEAPPIWCGITKVLKRTKEECLRCAKVQDFEVYSHNTEHSWIWVPVHTAKCTHRNFAVDSDYKPKRARLVDIRNENRYLETNVLLTRKNIILAYKWIFLTRATCVRCRANILVCSNNPTLRTWNLYVHQDSIIRSDDLYFIEFKTN